MYNVALRTQIQGDVSEPFKTKWNYRKETILNKSSQTMLMAFTPNNRAR